MIETLPGITVPAPPKPTDDPQPKMKPSEALRLGSLQWGQSFGISTIEGEDGNTIAACAIATMHLMGLYSPDYAADDVVWSPCLCLGFRESRAAVLVHLNDAHRWPRTRIADWLEITGR